MSDVAGPGYNQGDLAQTDAFARLQAVLDHYGLKDLGQWAWGMLLQGATEDRIGLEIYEQPAFKQRFPVIEQRRAAGLPPVTAQQVIDYEDTWSQMARQAGLPASFASGQTAQELMAANVSAAEAQARLQDGFQRVAQADQGVQDAFGHWFGASGTSALAAFFVDPDRALPDLERIVTESEIGGAATRQGFDLRQQLAESAARAGVTGQQAQQSFQGLEQNKALFNETIGENNDLKIEEQGAAAALGLDSNAAAEIKRRAQQRQAAYAGNDNATISTAGVTGLGEARTT